VNPGKRIPVPYPLSISDHLIHKVSGHFFDSNESSHRMTDSSLRYLFWLELNFSQVNANPSTMTISHKRRFLSWPTWSLFRIVLISAVMLLSSESKFSPKIDIENSSSDLFEIAHEIEVSAPSQFPKPTWLLDDPDVVVVAEPAFGKHRPDQDVVMAYAEGYSLAYYMCFIETLRDTGFDGDIVLAIADYSILERNVLEYLKTKLRIGWHYPVGTNSEARIAGHFSNVSSQQCLRMEG
jgi:hypothetical protein